MPWKGKQPRCKNCGHVHFKHKSWIEDGVRYRLDCLAVGCNCQHYDAEKKDDHRWVY